MTQITIQRYFNGEHQAHIDSEHRVLSARGLMALLRREARHLTDGWEIGLLGSKAEVLRLGLGSGAAPVARMRIAGGQLWVTTEPNGDIESYPSVRFVERA